MQNSKKYQFNPIKNTQVGKTFLNFYQHLFPLYETILADALRNCESVLDVGCGWNSPLARIPKRFSSTGVDLFQPSLTISKKRKIHDRYVRLDVRQLATGFAPRSFDAVLASDVLEHLTKKEGEKLLASMEKIARKRVIVFTPNGFIPQEVYEDNVLQRHQSGWSACELESRGYVVRGFHGWKWLRGERSTLRIRPKKLGVLLSDLSQLFVWKKPDWAFSLFAVKIVKK